MKMQCGIKLINTLIKYNWIVWGMEIWFISVKIRLKIKQKKIKILNNKQCLFTIRVNLHIFISKIFEIRLNKHSIKYFFFKLAVYWISNRQNKINGDNIQFYLKVYNTKCHKYNSNWNVPLQFAISVMFLLCHF